MTLNKITCDSLDNISDHSIKRQQLDKKEQRNWLNFLITINFKVRKTIRWQMKTSNMFMISIGGIKNSQSAIFKWLQKEQQKETTKRNSIKVCEKTLSKP